MAVARTGSVYSDNTNDTARNSIAVTIPSDAVACIVIGFGLYFGGDRDFTELNFDNDSDMEFSSIVKSTADGSNHQVFAKIITDQDTGWPGTGSKTLYWKVNQTGSYGSWVIAFFLTGLDTTDPIIGTASQMGTATWTSPSLGTVGADDLAMIAMGGESAAIQADYGSGQSIVIETGVSNLLYAGVGEELGEETPSIDGQDFCGGVAFALLAGGEESSSSSSSSSSSQSSSSSSSSESSFEKGCVVYGQDTDVVEPFPRDFLGNWTGTADIEGSGDSERIVFEAGENEGSESRYIGVGQKIIKLNQYQSGKGTPTIEYGTGATKADCDSAGWSAYSGSFSSLGWVKVRLST